MKYVTLCHIKPGMVLAKPICNESGVILLGKNIKLTELFCNKLLETCPVKGIYIYDALDLVENQVFKNLINEKSRSKMIQNGEILNLDAVNFLATTTVDNARNSSLVSKYLLELYKFSQNTFEHSIRVAKIATITGIGLGLSNEELFELSSSALLHDIGKLKIDASLINKNGKLTPKEKETINQHPFYGYEMLKAQPKIGAKIKCGILMHHENEDGSGYPKGIKGKDTYVFAKIIHIADVYDALVNERAYKDALSINDAIEYMMTQVGIMFDEKLFDIFMTYVELFKVGDRVLLSTNEQASVLENHPHYMLRPTIQKDNTNVIDLHSDMKSLNVVIKNRI